MRLLFVAAESAPLVKVGGLGDVIGALPAALRARGHDVRVVMPSYRGLDAPGAELLWSGRERFVEQAVDVRVLAPTPTILLVECAEAFDRDQVYGEPDDGDRFALFARAVLAFLDEFEWKPEIVHAHDWHAALVPILEHDTPTVLTTDGRAVHRLHRHYTALFEKETTEILYCCSDRQATGCQESAFYHSKAN